LPWYLLAFDHLWRLPPWPSAEPFENAKYQHPLVHRAKALYQGV